MPHTPRNEELQELRRELNAVRAEYESYKKATIALRQFLDPSESAEFPMLPPEKIFDEIRRRSALVRIKRRLSALEQRLTEIEAAERASV
jgi:hypothetical protein